MSISVWSKPPSRSSVSSIILVDAGSSFLTGCFSGGFRFFSIRPAIMLIAILLGFVWILFFREWGCCGANIAVVCVLVLRGFTRSWSLGQGRFSFSLCLFFRVFCSFSLSLSFFCSVWDWISLLKESSIPKRNSLLLKCPQWTGFGDCQSSFYRKNVTVWTSSKVRYFISTKIQPPLQ